MSQKILVVEDEPDLSLVIVERLKTAGYDVSCADNGRAALERIKTNKPDLIITDVIMPELDGFGLLKELKKKTDTAAIPVIVLTARGKMSDTFKTMGVAEFLAKPFDDKVLLATVQKHMPGAKPSAPPVAQAPMPKPAVAGKKAFIAGIDPTTLKKISQQLSQINYFVDSASDAVQILGKVRTLVPDLILIEIPLDGIAAGLIVVELRKSPPHKTTPILLYSYQESSEGGTGDTRERALSIDSAKEECLEAGATLYIGSYNEITFLKTINKFL